MDKDIEIRELELYDIGNGFIETLSELSDVDMSVSDAEWLFLYFKQNIILI